jgi:tetratricopeptide (TPR) repeat protein
VDQVEDAMGKVFALAPDCDATQLRLTAAEGYLLSRVDGATPWRLLREMGGIPADEADTCLARWVAEGLLDVVSESSPSPTSLSSEERKPNPPPVDAAEAPAKPAPVFQIDESKIDDRLDLEIGVQRRILEFEASLGRPYHDLLDVPKGSEPKVVKRAYFKLSKEFHPDRYFRREIGDYARLLDRIFKKVLEAHEMLSDPDLCQVENQRISTPEDDEAAAACLPPSPGAPSVDESADSVPEKPKPLTKLERLRQRMPFKIDHAGIAARREQAQKIFKAAELSLSAGRLSEAEASIRIAISFDPGRTEFKEALGSIRIQAAGARATKLLAAPSEQMSDGELREALTLLEDVLIYRPHDPELNDRAARVCLQLGKLDLAKGFVETLIERAPDVAAHHTLSGRIDRERNDLDAAVRAFETALKLDEEDLDARRALASVRVGARNAARGGTS